MRARSMSRTSTCVEIDVMGWSSRYTATWLSVRYSAEPVAMPRMTIELRPGIDRDEIDARQRGNDVGDALQCLLLDVGRRERRDALCHVLQVDVAPRRGHDDLFQLR